MAVAPLAGAITTTRAGAVAPGAPRLVEPVPARWSTAFTYDPAHPYAGGAHRAITTPVVPGTAVRAPVGGTIRFAGRIPARGFAVTVATPAGWRVTVTGLATLAVASVGPRGPADGGRGVLRGAGLGSAGDAVGLSVRAPGGADRYVDPLPLIDDPAGPSALPSSDAGQASGALRPVAGAARSPTPGAARLARGRSAQPKAPVPTSAPPALATGSVRTRSTGVRSAPATGNPRQTIAAPVSGAATVSRGGTSALDEAPGDEAPPTARPLEVAGRARTAPGVPDADAATGGAGDGAGTAADRVIGTPDEGTGDASEQRSGGRDGDRRTSPESAPDDAVRGARDALAAVASWLDDATARSLPGTARASRSASGVLRARAGAAPRIGAGRSSRLSALTAAGAAAPRSTGLAADGGASRSGNGEAGTPASSAPREARRGVGRPESLAASRMPDGRRPGVLVASAPATAVRTDAGAGDGDVAQGEVATPSAIVDASGIDGALDAAPRGWDRTPPHRWSTAPPSAASRDRRPSALDRAIDTASDWWPAGSAVLLAIAGLVIRRRSRPRPAPVSGLVRGRPRRASGSFVGEAPGPSPATAVPVLRPGRPWPDDPPTAPPAAGQLADDDRELAA